LLPYICPFPDIPSIGVLRSTLGFQCALSKPQGLEGNTIAENLLWLGCNTVCELRQRATHLLPMQRKLQRWQTAISAADVKSARGML